MLSLLKWLLVLGTLAALFALVPVGGRTLLERAELLRGGGRAASSLPADAREEDDAPPSPAARSERHRAPERARPAPLPREKLSASDHAAVDRLITERAR